MVHRVERDEEVLSVRHNEIKKQSEKLGMNFHAAASDAAYARIRMRAAALKMGMMNWELYKVWRDEGRR